MLAGLKIQIKALLEKMYSILFLGKKTQKVHALDAAEIIMQ